MRAGERSGGLGGKKTPVLFFFSPSCRACDEVTAHVRDMEKAFADRIRVFYKDYTHPEVGVKNNTEYLRLLDHFKVKDTPSLSVAISNKKILAGHDPIMRDLTKTLTEFFGPPLAIDPPADAPKDKPGITTAPGDKSPATPAVAPAKDDEAAPKADTAPAPETASKEETDKPDETDDDVVLPSAPDAEEFVEAKPAPAKAPAAADAKEDAKEASAAGTAD